MINIMLPGILNNNFSVGIQLGENPAHKKSGRVARFHCRQIKTPELQILKVTTGILL